MVDFLVDDVPDDVVEAYQRRAEASGQSFESYMRDVLAKMALEPAQADSFPRGSRELRGE
jgi:plasmid stability protein